MNVTRRTANRSGATLGGTRIDAASIAQRVAELAHDIDARYADGERPLVLLWYGLDPAERYRDLPDVHLLIEA